MEYLLLAGAAYIFFNKKKKDEQKEPAPSQPTYVDTPVEAPAIPSSSVDMISSSRGDAPYGAYVPSPNIPRSEAPPPAIPAAGYVPPAGMPKIPSTDQVPTASEPIVLSSNIRDSTNTQSAPQPIPSTSLLPPSTPIIGAYQPRAAIS